jgi:hypothetical protein
VGTYGCHFDGLDELDTLGRGEGQEGREGGREGGRTGGEILFEGTLLVGNGLRAFVDVQAGEGGRGSEGGREKGREGGRTGGESLFIGSFLVGNGLRAFVDIEESTHTVACQEKRRKGGGW